jgi:hypothetical protein
MIVNAYAVLDAFITVLRLIVAVLVVALALRSRRGAAATFTAATGPGLEQRHYLLVLLASLLAFLNLASWPILYLLLDSYVSQWPGVMCIYGVTQVGTGSEGASRFLPTLLRTLEVLKPALVFGSGAGVMLYLANRGTVTAPLWGRILVVLVGLGTLAIVDAAAESAYLAIPKREEFLAAGCCANSGSDTARFAPSALLSDGARDALRVAYYAVNGGMILALLFVIRRVSVRTALPSLAALLFGAVLTAVVSGAFLIDVAAPTWLHLPQHHCAYDLIPRVPESVLGMASFALGTFAVGWACVTAWLGNSPETRHIIAELVRKTLLVGLFGYLGSLAFVIVEFVVS